MNPNAALNKKDDFRSWFLNKLLMGMTWPEYIRHMITPFNVAAAVILSVGLPLMGLRYIHGLEVVTDASNEYPWGLFLGWGLFSGVPLSATGFVMATAYYIFGFKRYKPLVRLAVLTGFLGYFFAVVYLMTDLGRPWRIYYPMFVGFGTASVLFLVAWHVATYLTVQFLEFSPAILEWLEAGRTRKWAMMITIAMTIAGIILSTLHQSALGALFLLAPAKMHPLWFTSYLPTLFLASSIYAALAMVIVVSTLAAVFLKKSADDHFLGNLNELTIGLGKGTSIGILVYLALKLVAMAHGDAWGLLGTPYGHWYLVEILGFVLLPALILAAGVKKGSLGLVRFGGFHAVIGVILNRINVSMVAFNWKLPDHLHHIMPHWQEIAVVLSIFTLHILIFRWILVRMPVIHQDQGFKQVEKNH
ncbi:MAG: hypothetical protein AUK29_09905 [Nitrospirae bacterium CG2_30_53_67]|nr:MAG: hypothetical protein AUK29_09905 [Nitrospirae bacterium CG2_30_53_67]